MELLTTPERYPHRIGPVDGRSLRVPQTEGPCRCRFPLNGNNGRSVRPGIDNGR